MSDLDAIAVENFRDYLRIPTVQPNINYDDCVEFLKKYGDDLGLVTKVHSPVPKKPTVLLSLVGTEPDLPAILLNSHMDVVPVFEDSWTYPPFEAHIDENGDIYGRGAQDMKCVGIMYLEAIRRLKLNNVQLKRTLHVSFVPDEEIGSLDGLAAFVKTDEFKKLNIGFSLDEGVILPLQKYPLFYGEKAMWELHIHCCGTPNHGSSLFPNTAGDKFRKILNKFLDHRDEQLEKIDDPNSFPRGDITSLNLTQVYGGIQHNVVPEKLSAVFDIRLSLEEDADEFEKKIQNWCKEAGEDVYAEFKLKSPLIPASKMDEMNPLWLTFKQTVDKLGLNVWPVICPGNTDSRFLREVGIPAFGFTPINETPLLLHGHDERINKGKLLEGIRIYYEILAAVANA